MAAGRGRVHVGFSFLRRPDAVDAQVAIDADGDGVTIWERSDATGFTKISGRARSKTGVPGPGQTLSAGGGNAVDPQVAISANGRAVAVWSRRDGSFFPYSGSCRTVKF